jgi:hypothetical protein
MGMAMISPSELFRMPDDELRAAAVELCARGLLTCTKGRPGEPAAEYALAWLPLDEPESYPEVIRERHAANMRRFTSQPGGSEGGA